MVLDKLKKKLEAWDARPNAVHHIDWRYVPVLLGFWMVWATVVLALVNWMIFKTNPDNLITGSLFLDCLGMSAITMVMSYFFAMAYIELDKKAYITNQMFSEANAR